MEIETTAISTSLPTEKCAIKTQGLWPRAQLFVIRSRIREILGPQYSVTTIHNQDPTYMLARLTQLALPFLSHTKVDPSQFRASMSTSERQS